MTNINKEEIRDKSRSSSFMKGQSVQVSSTGTVKGSSGQELGIDPVTVIAEIIGFVEIENIEHAVFQGDADAGELWHAPLSQMQPATLPSEQT